MAITVHCDIVSADESLFSGSVEMIVATGSLGELGITCLLYTSDAADE